MSRTPHHRHGRVRVSHGDPGAAVPPAATVVSEARNSHDADATRHTTEDAAIGARLDAAEQVPPRPLGRTSRLSQALRRVGAGSIVRDAVTIETVALWSNDVGPAVAPAGTAVAAEATALTIETTAVTAEALANARSDDEPAAAALATGEPIRLDAAGHDGPEPTVLELSELAASARQMVLARRYRLPLDDAHAAALCAAAGRLADEAHRYGCRRIAVVRVDGGDPIGAWCGALAASLAALDRGGVLYVESTEALTDASIDAINDERTVAWLDGQLDWKRAVRPINELGFDALAASRDLFERRAVCRESDRREWLEAAGGYAFVLFDACQWRAAATAANLPPVDAVVLSIELGKTPKRSAHDAQARWMHDGVRVLGALALQPLAA